MRHPAHTVDYDTLVGGLNAAIAAGLVYERRDGDLSLFCYTKRAVYDQAWTPAAMMARGLVVDRAVRRVAATPFPKFFNLGERGGEPPEGGFEATEKLDGSLIIAFHHDGRWRTVTKGDFEAAQAKAAQVLLPFGRMTPGVTWLSEMVGPSNKVVVRYERDECRLLGAFAEDGREMTRSELESSGLGMPMARTFACGSLAELIAHTETLPIGEEGYVLRFAEGTRLKLKGAEYRRLHALISGLSPLSVWDAIGAGHGDDMRRELPEEFWGDYDAIRALLALRTAETVAAVTAEAAKWDSASDKEVGLALPSIPEPARSFVFAHRRGAMASPKTKAALHRLVRPDGNALAGYTPSYAVRRIADEAG